MAVLTSVLTVLFVIMSIILVILILLQSDKGSGMGIMGGSSNSAFGSSTADVVTKITGFLVALFMIGSLGLSILESSKHSVEKKLTADSGVTNTSVIDKSKNGVAEKKATTDKSKDNTKK